MFVTHWRWNATIGLGVQRFRNGRKVPPQFQRSDAEDLLAVVFPDQLACAENIVGQREVPDHPLVNQTVADCLDDLMDIDGLEDLLRRIEAGEVTIITRELSSPSPLSQEVITARPYAFLDDAPAEERRTLAIRTRHLLDVEDASGLADLDAAVIAEVCARAWPSPRNPDELHDGLMVAGFLTASEVAAGNKGSPAGRGWQAYMDPLLADRRVTRVRTGEADLWVCAERLAEALAVHPGAQIAPAISPALVPESAADRESAMRELVRGRLEVCGPVTVSNLALAAGVSEEDIRFALTALETEGFVMRGRYTGASAEEWCERRLLARIHKGTMGKLRREIEPVSAAIFTRFLLEWHGAGDDRQTGPEAVRLALARLEGFPVAASAWDKALLPTRVEQYMSVELDQAISSGEFLWLRAPSGDGSHHARNTPVSNTRIVVLSRAALEHWLPLVRPPHDASLPDLSSRAARVRDVLAEHGASFFADLVRGSGLLRTQVEEALAELVARGLVTADSFAGIRALTTPASKRASFSRPLSRRGISVDGAGRWELVENCIPGWQQSGETDPEALALHAALVLLDRYGVLFRALLQREMQALPPWRLMLRALRRLEARGEVRGGRFVNGFSGEQFALPEAVVGLRAVRRQGDDERLIAIAAADPLNLAGIVTPGDRVPAARGNRLLYRNGAPVAIQAGGRFTWLGDPDAQAEWSARNLLLRYEPRLTYVATPARS
jgi:ATP-dependent Lhr-like helicase